MSARAMVASKLANLARGGDRRSDQSANLHSGSVTSADAAEMFNVSERSVTVYWAALETARALADDPDAAAALAAWLDPAEIAALARAGAGMPIPPLDDIRAEAKLWASWATPAERRAYIAAIWNVLPRPDRSGFLAAARAG